MNNKIYEKITGRILEIMESSNELVWRKGWASPLNSSKNFVTKRPYTGFNAMVLSTIAGMNGQPNEWLTFKQIRDKKLSLNAGSKGVPIVYYGKTNSIKIVRDEEGNEEEKKVNRWFLKTYYVFNIADTDYDISLLETKEEKVIDIDENCSKIIKDYVEREKVTYIETESDRAFYSPLTDSVTVPSIKQYKETGEFYATNFHELVHSTGHQSRLDRFSDDKMVAFGSETYSKEELVAEIGASILCNINGFENTTENSVAYIKNWIERIKDKPAEFVSACNKAYKSVDFILGNK